MIRAAVTVLVLSGVALHMPIAEPAQARDIEAGQALAEKHCASCHAITTTGESPHKNAPSFRDVAGRYPVETLAEALAEGITVGHEDMPEFTFTPEEIDDLLSYLASLKQ